MSFRVSARTIIQLGAELISSDAVALLELIKNAFDAGSQRVTIEVVVRIPYPIVQDLKERMRLSRIDGTPSTLALESLNPNPPKDRNGRREDSGRG